MIASVRNPQKEFLGKLAVEKARKVKDSKNFLALPHFMKRKTTQTQRTRRGGYFSHNHHCSLSDEITVGES